jgi:pimeloyl-ACP methyl ester carboxylesterase
LSFEADPRKYITNAFSKYLGAMKLFFRESGQGSPLIILHGLFGSSDNWHTVAKTFAATRKVYLLDQRNHGQSPHSDDFNYRLLAGDLHQFMEDHGLERADVIGHSMGGKTAMNFAVMYPDQIEKLVVVDIVPKAYPIHHDRIVAGMKALALDQLSSRNEADAMLAPYVPDASERQFLLKNLVRKTAGGFQWKINVKAIDEHLEELGEGMQYPGKFEKPTLFIRGARSSYFKPGDEDEIRKIFPRARFVVLETGHWVQAERPVEFAQAVLDFLVQ